MIESLHSDLKPHVVETDFGLWLKHPLVNAHLAVNYAPHPDFPTYADLVNHTYNWKRDQLAEALESGDWGTYINTHEKYARVDALLEIADRLDHKAYWKLVGETWIMVEYPSNTIAEWMSIWDCGRPYRAYAMSKDGRRAFKAMPDELTVYRGVAAEDFCNAEFAADGFSWTTDREGAEWFARRNAQGDHKPFLATATVLKCDVLAYLIERNEAEIVLMPETWNRHIEVEELPAIN